LFGISAKAGWFSLAVLVALAAGLMLIREAFLTKRGNIPKTCFYAAGFVLLLEVLCSGACVLFWVCEVKSVKTSGWKEFFMMIAGLAIAVNLVLGIDKLITGHLQPEPNEKGIFAMELIVFGMLMGAFVVW